jgi:hypothetical protein
MDCVKIAKIVLGGRTTVTPEEIQDAINNTLSMPLCKDADPEALRRELESHFNIQVDDFRIIEAHERKRPWLNDRRASITWNFWNRYRDYLESEKGFSPKVLAGIDLLTDRILDSLFDPTEKIVIDKRGLVVGQVQSGKTSNYSGLICKAADSGVKLIIVLAGIHNNLRSQTQQRIDESFLGFDTQFQRQSNTSAKNMGVGYPQNKLVAHSLTSSQEKGDFSAGAANSLGLNFNTNDPIVAVVKKNGRVLERLLAWLQSNHTSNIDGKFSIRGKSLLLIDDEADNASINTNPDEDKSTKINGLIRQILGLFDQSAYVGYTATPFANIFIPIEDDNLFPRDFIVNLPAPSNYVGPQQVFGFEFEKDNDSLPDVFPIVERIKDENAFDLGKAKKDSALPTKLPASMERAIRCFILTCAVRRLRGQENVHNSMLIHISRFVTWQTQIKSMVEEVFLDYRRGIEFNVPAIIEEMRRTYEEDEMGGKSFVSISAEVLGSKLKDFDRKVQVHSWNAVLPHLHQAASRIKVKELNGSSADALNYFDHKNGLSVIAVGGDKLSRGLTLEGLSISYYLRASKMYDTLMQMGRWFGYRPGYVDLCRLFISETLNEWFCHITLASEELRREFEYMSEKANQTPERFALKVRTHPGVLQISASNKIRRATEVRVSWSGRLVETYLLEKDPEVVKTNFEAASELIAKLGTHEAGKGTDRYFLWEKVDLGLIEAFLQEFQVPENGKKFSPKNLLRFLNEKRKFGELLKWNVGVISKASGSDPVVVAPLVSVRKLLRSEEEATDGLYHIKKGHIISPSDEFIDLTEDEKARAIAESKDKKTLSGVAVREGIRKETGKVLLNLYFLEPSGAGISNSSTPIVGFAISFPGTDRNDAVAFAVHDQLLEVFNQEDTNDDPEDEED